MRISGNSSHNVRMMAAVSVAVLVIAAGSFAQQPSANGNDVQRQAMKKLEFLAGDWSGPVTIVRGPGEPLRLTQTEHVEFKLDGLVLVIEGTSTGADGKPLFEALATVAFDDATRTYRVRAYHGGHYVDRELTVTAEGFSWAFEAGPGHVVNIMRMTPKGQWQETTEVTMGNNPPQQSVEMLLQRAK